MVGPTHDKDDVKADTTNEPFMPSCADSVPLAAWAEMLSTWRGHVLLQAKGLGPGRVDKSD